jgi:hypothetical protein
VSDRKFKYPDEQWRRLERIVESAGGAIARDKFNAQRDAVEKMAGGWQERILQWDGFTWGDHDDDETYQSIESSAGELHAALVKLGFPALFSGNDLVWEHLGETEENRQRYDAFLMALGHLRARAALMAKPRRKQARLARDRFFVDLWRVWSGELRLRRGSSTTSRMVQFIKVASEGVCDPRDEPTLAMISNTIRKWPRH